MLPRLIGQILFKSKRWASNEGRFLPNRERIVYKNRKEAFVDYAKVSGFNLGCQLLLALVIIEFGFPTPDIVYDIKRLISPDFDLFCKTGNLVDLQLDFENKLRSVRKEEIRITEQALNSKSPEAKFGGIV